jgi:hypothetical protein
MSAIRFGSPGCRRAFRVGPAWGGTCLTLAHSCGDMVCGDMVVVASR